MDKTNFDEREGLPVAQSFINFSKYRRNKRFFPQKSKGVKPPMPQQGKVRDTEYYTPSKRSVFSPGSLSESVIFKVRPLSSDKGSPFKGFDTGKNNFRSAIERGPPKPWVTMKANPKKI